MILSNRFKEEDKRKVYDDYEPCADCGRNDTNLHHIDGCKEKYHSSIYNSVPLCLVCHKKADSFNVNGIKGEEIRQRYTKYTLLKVMKSNYKNKPQDKDYLESIKERLYNINK